VSPWRPAISVQVPVKDPGPSFSVFLGSLAAQAPVAGGWELVVADDGSREPVSSTWDLEAAGADRVVYLRIEGTGNRPAARNAALAASSAPVSFFADADLAYEPGVLAGHAAWHEGGEGILRGSRINAWSGGATPWQKWFDTRAGNLDPAGPMPWRHFVTGNASAPSSLVAGAGGFDPEIDRYGGEDTELGYRLSAAGVRFFRDPALRCRHLDEVTVRRHSEKMAEYGSSGLRRTLELHPEAAGLLGSGWVAPVFSGPASAVPIRLLVRLALLRPGYRAVLRWMEIAGRPSFLFLYLSVGGCLRGLTGRDL